MRPDNTKVLRKPLRDQLRAGRRSEHSLTYRQLSRAHQAQLEAAVTSVKGAST